MGITRLIEATRSPQHNLKFDSEIAAVISLLHNSEDNKRFVIAPSTIALIHPKSRVTLVSLKLFTFRINRNKTVA